MGAVCGRCFWWARVANRDGLSEQDFPSLSSPNPPGFPTSESRFSILGLAPFLLVYHIPIPSIHSGSRVDPSYFSSMSKLLPPVTTLDVRAVLCTPHSAHIHPCSRFKSFRCAYSIRSSSLPSTPLSPPACTLHPWTRALPLDLTLLRAPPPRAARAHIVPSSSPNPHHLRPFSIPDLALRAQWRTSVFLELHSTIISELRGDARLFWHA
jgi:hypothetical protein